MSRTYSPTVAASESLTEAIEESLPASMDAVLTEHAGSGTPPYAKPYTTFVDTADGWAKQRNAADDADIELYPVGRRASTFSVVAVLGDITAAGDQFLWVADQNVTITRVRLVSRAATSSSASNEVTFGLENLTQTADLFSTTVGTDTSLVGVGGGSDLVADTAYNLVPDQNADLVGGDVLELQVGIVGTPAAGDLTGAIAIIEGYRRP